MGVTELDLTCFLVLEGAIPAFPARYSLTFGEEASGLCLARRFGAGKGIVTFLFIFGSVFGRCPVLSGIVSSRQGGEKRGSL